jgi:hypothetical protein
MKTDDEIGTECVDMTPAMPISTEMDVENAIAQAIKMTRQDQTERIFAELDKMFLESKDWTITQKQADKLKARLSPTSRSEFTPSRKRKSRCLGTEVTKHGIEV